MARTYNSSSARRSRRADVLLVRRPDVDDAVRALFAPTPIVDENGLLPTADQLASSAAKAPSTNTAPFVRYGVSGANLDEMQTYLLRGERREAVRYALDHKMWAHAFIIASCVDTDCWKDVTIEFLRSELTPSPESAAPGAEGREALRVAYGMFAGLGAESSTLRSLIAVPIVRLTSPHPQCTSSSRLARSARTLPVSCPPRLSATAHRRLCRARTPRWPSRCRRRRSKNGRRPSE